MESEYPRMVARIERSIVYVGLVGLPVAGYVWGWRGALGFILGTILSRLNFNRLRAIVDALGTGQKKVSVLRIAGLYFLIGLAGYVIIKYFEVAVLSTVAGLLLVPLGAILFEVIYAFIYGT
jgi:ATP synthase I chain